MSLRRGIWFILLSAAVLTLAITLHYVIQKKPEVNIQWSLTKADLEKARRILNQEPASEENPLQILELNEKELNLVANYILNRYAKSATLISLHANSLGILTTLNLPKPFFGSYLNIRIILTFDEGRRHPTLSEVKVGSLHIAPTLAGRIINAIIRHSALQSYYILAISHISDIELYARKIVVIYRPSATTLRQARSLLNLDTGVDALHAYRQKLAEAIDKHDPGWRLSLAELLQPLFALAVQRSAPDTAVEENRAVIYTIAAYVNNQKLPTLLEDQEGLTPLPQQPVFVYKRIDMAQHFMAAAALSAAGNSYLGDKLGVEKELQDAKGGSGFSFIDLAADRAGSKFGEIAVSNAESARSLQLAMAKTYQYNAFMPDVTDLPENMDEEAFKNRFVALDSPETQTLIAQIDARIESCPIFAAFKE